MYFSRKTFDIHCLSPEIESVFLNRSALFQKRCLKINQLVIRFYDLSWILLGEQQIGLYFEGNILLNFFFLLFFSPFFLFFRFFKPKKDVRNNWCHLQWFENSWPRKNKRKRRGNKIWCESFELHISELFELTSFLFHLRRLLKIFVQTPRCMELNIFPDITGLKG